MTVKLCDECGCDINDPKSFNGYCSTCADHEEVAKEMHYEKTEMEYAAEYSEEEERHPFITIFDLAKFRGVKEDADGSVSMGAFDDVGLPLLGGCQNCGAQLAAYNMCPTKTGNCSCLDCVHAGNGFETVEEANRFCFPHEYAWLGVNKVADKTEPDQMEYDENFPSENDLDG